MGKVYICDSCRTVIDNPFEVRMKEFYIGRDFELEGVFLFPSTCKRRIHLCDECYKNLRYIGNKKEENE